MKIETDEVRRIAKLAQLEFEESELPRLAHELSAILTYMDSLGRVDTTSVDPTFHPLAIDAPFREDLPRPSFPPEEATGGAPEGQPGQFVVPRVIG